MRIPLIAGNWKMYKTPAEAAEFCARFRELYKDTDVQAAILAPAVDIPAVAEAFKGTKVQYGAQNVYFEKEGAYTGETSIGMIKSLGCSFSIVGHSERRQYFGETDETVNLKAKALLAEGLRPIICVGEAEEIRVAGTQNEHVKRQLIGAFAGIPAEENQYNYKGTYIEYFDHVFKEEFPSYRIEHELWYQGKRAIFTFWDGGRKALVVEVLNSNADAKKLRAECAASGVPYLRYYHDHDGWWNTRAYVTERTRKALQG